MAEPVYLFYGDLQINQLDFLNKAANDVPNYINSQPWSKKRKERVMNAYSDIMNRGLKGASNSTGRWVIDINGDGIDFDSKSNKEKEAYQEAAYIILQQMSKISTVQANQPKKDLLKFDNEYFTTSFDNYISDKEFGGRLWNIGGEDDDWNKLDERNELGIRGTKNRADKLANLLESYSNSLKEDEYDFEGSPFENLNDFKTRIHRAVLALRSKSLDDDDDALNTIGLRYSKYFNTGANDSFSKDNYLGTYQDYYQRYLPEQQRLQEETKRKEEEAKKQAIVNKGIQRMQNAWNRVMVFGKGKTGNFTHIEDGMDYLNSILQKDKLTNEEVSEVLGAFQLASKNNGLTGLSRAEIDRLPGNWRGRANSLRKINGIEGMYLDSASGNIVKFRKDGNNQTGVTNFLDILKKELPENKEKEYLNSKIPGITNAEWKELSAIGLDIASIVNPEAITGSGMSLAAAGLRHSAKNDSNPNWNFGDYFWLGIDYLTGALGGIQVVGDLVLGAKTMATASKALPILRKMARLGAWTDLYLSYPDLKEATRKIANGEDLTVKDWRAIGQGIRGLVSHGRLNRSNRAERRVLEKSGQNITPENVSSIRGKLKETSLKLGFTRTKPVNTTATVKATINGKESDIEISSDIKAKILKKVKEAGNDAKARNEAVKEVLKSEGKINANDKVEVETPSIRDWKYFPEWLGTSRNLFGTKRISSQQGKDIFNEYISGKRGYWDRYKYGSDTELKGIYNRLELNNPSDKQNSREQQFNKATINKYKEYLKGKFSNKELKSGEYDLFGNNLRVVELSDGTFNIIYKGNIEGNYLRHQLKELQLKIFDLVRKTRRTIDKSGKSTKRSITETGKILLDLKRKGWLKQGGQLNLSAELIVSNFLNNKNENNF